MMPLADDVNIPALCKMTDEYTGAGIASFASPAAMIAMKEHTARYKQDSGEAQRQPNELEVQIVHFEQGLKKDTSTFTTRIKLVPKNGSRICKKYCIFQKIKRSN